jgi:hypothetical protein
MLWKIRCCIAWLISLIAISIVLGGLLVAGLIIIAPEAFYMHGGWRAGATIVCISLMFGALIHFFGMVITQTDSWLPKFNKNPD